jgi:hypothetical protein
VTETPDYRPPWGLPQSPEDFERVHPRWYEKLPLRENAAGDAQWTEQCGGCRYYIPLDGTIGEDWGACSNPLSLHDRTVVFEHYGCPHHATGTMKVYLDDEREPPPGWTRTRTVQETIDWLQRGEVTHLSLDHDLGDEANGTGYDVLLWIERAVQTWGYMPPDITIHSANVSARVKMDLAVRSIRRLSGAGDAAN